MRFLVIFAALVLSASAHAQTINACAKNRGGALRIVSSPADCTSRETPISWGQQGPSLFLSDANGLELGLFVETEGHTYFFSEEIGALVTINRVEGLVRSPSGPNLRFTELDCQGEAFSDDAAPGKLLPNQLYVVVTPSGIRYLVMNPDVADEVLTRSRMNAFEQSDLPHSCSNEDKLATFLQTLTDVTNVLPFPDPVAVPLNFSIR